MTQEDKELLLKDLCARLPYGIKVHIKGEYHKYHKIEEIDVSNECVRYFENLHLYEEKITDCRLYLRPMSSMTEEERKEYERFSRCSIGLAPILMDWLYSHHLDCCELIPKGLALEAPKGIYIIKSKY